MSITPHIDWKKSTYSIQTPCSHLIDIFDSVPIGRLRDAVKNPLQSILGQKEAEVFLPFTRQIQQSIANRGGYIDDRFVQTSDSRYGFIMFATRQTRAAS